MSAPPTLFQRAYAAGYDVFMRLGGKFDRRNRQQLVEGAEGEVLEAGCGTGLSFGYYRSAARVVGIEPDPGMRARAVRRAREARVPVEVRDGDAQRLDFPDASFDTVIFGLVLCTIPDPAAALAEARRVLRPGGVVRFWEHVRAPDPRLAATQDRWERRWMWFGRGCHPNRDTVAAVEAAGYRMRELARFTMPGPIKIVAPHVQGVAERP